MNYHERILEDILMEEEKEEKKSSKPKYTSDEIREMQKGENLTKRYKARGILTFVQNKTFTEYIWLFTADEYEGELIECDEGILEWIDKDKLSELELWEGDRIFLELLNTQEEFFSLKLEYEEDKLVNYSKLPN